MVNPRAGAVWAATLALAVAFAGCLGGTPATPKVAVTLLTDSEVFASPGWTVGWAVEAFESVQENGTMAFSWEAPAGWSARIIKNDLTIAQPKGRAVSFLLVDVPADAANATYTVKVKAALGANSAEATGTVKVSRPSLNVAKNGSVIQMDYVGFLDTNEVFDTSLWAVANSSGLTKFPDYKNSSAARTQTDYHPLQFTAGNKQVIKGWDEGVLGMALGQGKALIIASEDAYGVYVNQSVNLTQYVPIYNQTSIPAFQPVYGELPVEDAQFVDPTYGWPVRVVSVDNASGAVVLENLPDMNRSYTPFGVNATLANLSSASGNFEVHYAPVLHEPALQYNNLGEVVDINATAFTVRFQIRHDQALAPYTLYFLVFVRGVAG